MKSCGNPKAYLSVGIGIILMLITVYLTIALSAYLVQVENQNKANAGNAGNAGNTLRSAQYMPPQLSKYSTY